MSNFQNCSPEIRRYLMKYQIPDVLESLFTALMVNQPEDVRQFMLEKVRILQADRNLLQSLRWNTFIDEDKKPANRIKNIEFLWCYEDERDQPTPHMYEKAYSFYNSRLLNICYYRGLQRYWFYKREKRRVFNLKLNKARKFYQIRFSRIHFKSWLEWTRIEIARYNKFMQALKVIFDLSPQRMVFEAWHSVTVDAINTREYFDRIERGEKMDNEEVTGMKTDHLSLMKKSIATHVFRFIDLRDLVNCSRVCRTWKELTQSTILWSRIDLTNGRVGPLAHKSLTSLIQKCRPFLCHLNIRGCDYLTPNALYTIGDCRNLQDLNISSCEGISDEFIRDVTNGCQSLLYVNMSRTSISDAALRYLSRNCSSIQYLNIAHCSNLTNHGLHYLASGKASQKLIYLDISGLDQISKEGYKYLSKGMTRLNTILLNELPSLTDECLENLIPGCKNLRGISILHSPLLTDNAFKYIANSKMIQTLKFESNMKITDSSMVTFLRQNRELRHLYFVDIQRLTDISLKSLGQSRNLNVINVADCVRLSDTGVRYLVEGLSGSRIKEMNLTNCVRVSDVSLLRISQKCSSLTYANFSYCEHVTDAGVELLATISSLTSLDLSGCNITDTGIAALGSNSNFKDIILSECHNITDIGIQKLVPKVGDLDNFDVSHINEITDQAIKSLAFSCRRLRVLNVSGCVYLSDQGLQYLSGVCQYIEKLDVSACKKITDKSLRYLRKGCHNLKTLTMYCCTGISKASVDKTRKKIKGELFHSQEDTHAYLGYSKSNE